MVKTRYLPIIDKKKRGKRKKALAYHISPGRIPVTFRERVWYHWYVLVVIRQNPRGRCRDKVSLHLLEDNR